MKILISKNGKTFFICFSFLLVTSHVVAQEKPSVVKNQFKINMLSPGLVYEHGVSSKNALYSEFNIGVGYKSKGFWEVADTWAFYPTIIEQFRHYYNLEKRASKGKDVSKNSGSFIALTALYGFKSINTNKDLPAFDPVFVLAPVWGFQKTFKNSFNLSFNAGVGYNFNKVSNNNRYNLTNNIVPLANFSLGWVIGK